MVTLVSTLHDAIAAVCPIDGVSMGNPADKSSWRIDYDPSATPDQQKAAQAAVAAFDPKAPLPWDVSKATLIARLITAGLLDTAHAALIANPSQFWRFLTADAVTSDNAEAVAFVKSLGADPTVILAPE